MNAPSPEGRGVMLVAVPRWIVLIFAGALILNATTTLLITAALLTHLLGGRS